MRVNKNKRDLKGALNFWNRIKRKCQIKPFCGHDHDLRGEPDHNEHKDMLHNDQDDQDDHDDHGEHLHDEHLRGIHHDVHK